MIFRVLTPEKIWHQ